MFKSLVRKLPFSYAWVILFVLVFGLFTSFGARASFGAFVTPWETDFAVSRTIVTSISTLNFIVYAIAQPFTGRLNDKLGGRIIPGISITLVGLCLILSSFVTQLWQLFILYGVGLSLGVAGCSNVVVTAVVSNWFKEKRGLALGLASTGMALGQLIVVPVSLFLIDSYSWRMSLKVLGIIILVVVTPLIVTFIRSKPEELGLRPYGDNSIENNKEENDKEEANPKTNISITSVIKHKVFWQLAVSYFVCGFTDVGIISTHLIPFAQGRGFITSIVAITFSVIAVFNIVGSIATGYMSDHFNRSRQLGIVYSARAIAFIFLLIMKSSWLLIPFAVVYGVTELASIAPTSSLLISLFGKQAIGTIFGFISLFHQIGGAAGSWISGLIFDITGSYNSVLFIAIALLFGSALLVIRVPEPRSKAAAEIIN